MRELLTVITENAVVIINAMALLMVIFGTIQAFIAAVQAMFNPSLTGNNLRHGYMRFARWLVAGLTFQLAADIIETAISPDWEDIGLLAAIAVIRTFLSYFLERDMKEFAEMPSEHTKEGGRSKGKTA